MFDAAGSATKLRNDIADAFADADGAVVLDFRHATTPSGRQGYTGRGHAIVVVSQDVRGWVNFRLPFQDNVGQFRIAVDNARNRASKSAQGIG